MKVIKHDLGDFETLHILPLADPHIGAQQCDFHRLQEKIAYIRDNENVYTILNGDLVDMAVRTSIGDVYGQTIAPMAALEQCVKIFGPIADKILCANEGNHELRIYKTDGILFTQLMCSQLGIADRYSSASTLLFIRFGEHRGKDRQHGRPVCYTIYCVHGSGGGKKEGGKAQRLSDLAGIIDADVYVHSHTHLPIILKERFYRVSAANSSVSLVDKLFVNTGAMLEYGGYGELQSFKPASLDTPIIHLDGRQRKLSATL